FLGPNGAGKSTTIKMLTTMLKATAGELRIAGHNPSIDPNGARSNFGIVFQDPSLDDELTAKENLLFHGALYDIKKGLLNERMEKLLKVVELWDRKNDLVKQFSGGMKRRLEIARGLLHHPKILFLDEPTIGLDPQTRHHIWNHILELNKSEGITIFFTTHYMEEAEHVADRVAVIDHGRIITIGTTKELLKRTKKKDLESAFIALTGKGIREEEGSFIQNMRLRRRVMRR
ncbi:multidrug ABC transporter ATP-binding protein, partial [Candidatus Woesearchaeota archaeon CG08_land_8_20_14_0_20_43_7]